MQHDWVIIGGGIHGVHIAARLLGEAGVERRRLAIVDPGVRLLDRWRTCTATTGMTHLRSPSVHNLDLAPWSMMDLAAQRHRLQSDVFALPFNRPTLGFFNDHCDHVIETFGLGGLHVRARASKLEVGCEHVAVSLDSGEDILTANVVLAIGAGEQPHWPAWSPPGDRRVSHIFAPDFDDWPSNQERVAVVGGGISAVQVALRLADEGHDVHVLSRHRVREHQFDSEPGWLGPRFMTGFHLEKDADKRRIMISGARHRGSVPPSVRHALERALEERRLVWHETDVDKLDANGPVLALQLGDESELAVDRVLLATGFDGHRPGGALVDGLIESASLPCAKCGYPVVDEDLRWHPRVYVSGPLAELELGPTSRNIAGARRAADRLVEAAQSMQNTR